MTNFMTVVYPLMSFVYSKMIDDCKLVTKARNRESRISPNQRDAI